MRLCMSTCVSTSFLFHIPLCGADFEIIPTNKIPPVSCHWARWIRFAPRARCFFRGRPAQPAIWEATRPIPWYQPRTGYVVLRYQSRCRWACLWCLLASLPSSACIAFRNWWASANTVLILAEKISSTFVPRGFAVLYLISRSGEGMVTEEKRKKSKINRGIRCLAKCERERIWYSAQGPGRMAQTPQAGTGDSVSRFRRSRCSTLFNYYSYFTLIGQFCFQVLFTT